jgi:hypothetical protein
MPQNIQLLTYPESGTLTIPWRYGLELIGWSEAEADRWRGNAPNGWHPDASRNRLQSVPWDINTHLWNGMWAVVNNGEFKSRSTNIRKCRPYKNCYIWHYLPSFGMLYELHSQESFEVVPLTHLYVKLLSSCMQVTMLQSRKVEQRFWWPLRGSTWVQCVHILNVRSEASWH